MHVLGVIDPCQFVESPFEHAALHFVVAAEELAVDQPAQVKDAPPPGSFRPGR